VVALYWLGGILNNRIAGLLAALLLAFSEFHIWYSHEARMYTLLALSATLFASTSVCYLQGPTHRRAVWSVVSGVALLYSHPFGTLTWSSISLAILAIIVRSHDLKLTAPKWIITQSITGVLFLPWALVLMGRAKNIAEQGFWIQEPSFDFAVNQFNRLASGSEFLIFLCAGSLAALITGGSNPTPKMGLRKLSTTAAVTEVGAKIGLLFTWLAGPTVFGTRLSVLLVIPLVIAATLPLRLGYHSRFYWPLLKVSPTTILLVTWLILPTILGLLASVVFQPIFLARYLLGLLPAWLLLASIGIASLTRTLSDVFVVSGLIIGLGAIGPMQDDVRQDWRAVGDFLAEKITSEDCVLIYKGILITPLQYYYRHPITCLATPKSANAFSLPMSTDRLWVVLGHDKPEERDALFKSLSLMAWKTVEQREFAGGIRVILLTKPA
jgi:hypothetical protein